MFKLIVHNKIYNMHSGKRWEEISFQTESIKLAIIFNLKVNSNILHFYLLLPCLPKMFTDTDKQFQNSACGKHKTCLVTDMRLIEDLSRQTHSKYHSLIIKCVCAIKQSTSGDGATVAFCPS